MRRTLMFTVTVFGLIAVMLSNCAAQDRQEGSTLGDQLIADLLDVWNSKEVERVDQIFADSCIYKDVPTMSKHIGRDGVKNWMNELFALSADATVELTSSYVTDDWAAIEWVWKGTHTGDIPDLIKATGKTFATLGASIIEFRGGKIWRNTDYYDLAGFYGQLGVELKSPVVQNEN